MLYSCMFSCTSTQMSCYAAVRSLALPHTHTHTSRYAPVRSLALPHSVMLRYCTFCVFFFIYRAKQPLFLLFTMALLAARCVDPWSVTPKPFKWSAYAPTKAKFPEKTRQFLIWLRRTDFQKSFLSQHTVATTAPSCRECDRGQWPRSSWVYSAMTSTWLPCHAFSCRATCLRLSLLLRQMAFFHAHVGWLSLQSA